MRQCNAGLKHKEGDYYDSLAAGFSVLVAGTPAPQEVCPSCTCQIGTYHRRCAYTMLKSAPIQACAAETLLIDGQENLPTQDPVAAAVSSVLAHKDMSYPHHPNDFARRLSAFRCSGSAVCSTGGSKWMQGPCPFACRGCKCNRTQSKHSQIDNSVVPLPKQALVVDCANGVGAQKLAALAERLQGCCNNNKGAGPDLLHVDVRNAGEDACRYPKP